MRFLKWTRLQSFEEIKSAFVNNSVAKYAHCIVAKSVNTTVPSFILCLLGTDSKYKHSDITLRWKYIASSLGNLGITVLSNGADGAGPFLKAMINESKLFSRSEHLPVKWTFFLMPIINAQNLNAQDHVHLLAKLRSRLLKPSNLLVLGTETACRAHIQHVFDKFPKEKHNLTQRAIDNRDKQNYTSIPSLISKDVEHCLMDLNPKIRNLGTIVYLRLMRNIRDSVFNKSISPLKRIELVWTAVFFCRIWRKWIQNNGYSEKEHFVTDNISSCIEINGHLILSLVVSVLQGKLPKECLRIWTTGYKLVNKHFVYCGQ